jgi:hypothetical protein
MFLKLTEDLLKIMWWFELANCESEFGLLGEKGCWMPILTFDVFVKELNSE